MCVRDSILTRGIHIVIRVTSGLILEELAESHVNKLLRWQPRTPSHREEARRGRRKHQVATHRLSQLRKRFPLNHDKGRVR
jgi:hypothetical protein